MSIVTDLIINNEIPVGDIDGVNKVFTLTKAPNPEKSLELFLNGKLQVIDVDYTLYNLTITFETAPWTGSNLKIHYRYVEIAELYLELARITDAGSLAGKDKADFNDDVDGAEKPENNADVTGDHEAATIAGQGNLATENAADFDTQVDGAEKPDNNADVTGDHEADINIDNIVDGATHKKLTATKDTKIDGVESGATHGAEFGDNISGGGEGDGQVDNDGYVTKMSALKFTEGFIILDWATMSPFVVDSGADTVNHPGIIKIASSDILNNSNFVLADAVDFARLRFDKDPSFKVRFKVDNNSDQICKVAMGWYSGSANPQYIGFWTDGTVLKALIRKTGEGGYVITISGIDPTVWHTYEVRVFSGVNARFYVDGVYKTQFTTHLPIDSGLSGIFHGFAQCGVAGTPAKLFIEPYTFSQGTLR
ncbi:hypothetical protein KAR28_06215 [Candidatus Parcubacteria bacterium]|nr:hypothetical protein [Candidatus Parcubacteria bacterium]